MSDGQPEALDERILVLAPTARDAATSREILEAAGIRSSLCNTIADICREAGRGAGAAVITAEAILSDHERRLAAWLKTQPPWSDFPLVVLTPPGAESPKLLQALDAVGPMTLMKRPVLVSTLVSTIRSALRDRRRQYAVRDYLAERLRVAEMLREERERYRVTLGSIGDAVIATDTEGRMTFLNQVAEQLTGWDIDSARDRPLEEVFRIVNEANHQRMPNPAQQALKQGSSVGLSNHTLLIAKDGTERLLDDSAAPIRGAGGEIIGTVLVFRDITEKQKVERALARDALLLANVHDAVIVTDLGGVITYWNEGATRLFGWSAQEMLGRPYADRYPESVRSWVAREIPGKSQLEAQHLQLGVHLSEQTHPLFYLGRVFCLDELSQNTLELVLDVHAQAVPMVPWELLDALGDV